MLDTIQWIADRSASSALNGRARCTDNRAQLIKFISGIGHTRTPCAGGTCLVRPEASKHLSCRIRKSCKTNSLQFKKQKWRNIDLILRVSYSGSTPCKWLRLRFETRRVFYEVSLLPSWWYTTRVDGESCLLVHSENWFHRNALTRTLTETFTLTFTESHREHLKNSTRLFPGGH